MSFLVYLLHDLQVVFRGRCPFGEGDAVPFFIFD
jgi:hypothetical protein